MYEEIERKFILKEMPNNINLSTPIRYERYYLYFGNGIELRIQRKDDKYELERKERKVTLAENQ